MGTVFYNFFLNAERVCLFLTSCLIDTETETTESVSSDFFILYSHLDQIHAVYGLECTLPSHQKPSWVIECILPSRHLQGPHDLECALMPLMQGPHDLECTLTLYTCRALMVLSVP
jgi:hypothetical protein